MRSIVGNLLMGVRGSGQDAESRRARAEQAMRTQERLQGLMTANPFGAFLSEEQIQLAAQVEPDNRQIALVRDTIRRSHLAVLVTLAEWMPGMSTDVLIEAAGRVKQLVELDATIAETVKKATEKKG